MAPSLARQKACQPSCALLQDSAGLSFGKPEDKMGWNAQPTCAVVMDQVKIPAADRLGAEGAGFSIAMNACEYIVYDGWSMLQWSH